MEDLLSNPAFVTYAICATVLAIKMILSAAYTGVTRQRHVGYVNNEDAHVFGHANAQAAAQGLETEEVAHALRIQRNDLENIPIFFAIGLLYVLSGATPFGASVYMWTFTIARLVHTGVYMGHLQPWRAISYVVGALAIFGMCTQILMSVL